MRRMRSCCARAASGYAAAAPANSLMKSRRCIETSTIGCPVAANDTGDLTIG
jgi:hypothetical protein